ncbi:MAG: hypothetical protein WC746_05570 [archaeon]|jgi:hypothetical protein
MDFAEKSPRDLELIFVKRQRELFAIGRDLSSTYGAGGANQHLDKTISDLVEIAKELTKRRIRVPLDISIQHPVIQKRILKAISKTTLLTAMALQKRPRRTREVQTEFSAFPKATKIRRRLK